MRDQKFTTPFNADAKIQSSIFATVNQMFGGSSQLPTTAERAVIKSNQIVELSSDNIVGSWEEPPNI